MPVIRTPDQRLRIFVSSTMRELAAERAAARDAVEELHLSPILFELGARPHPPRELYQAYLEQSQVFVGIYWESYGWIAPDMDISGLEHEYVLAEDMPKLIYVKDPGDREPRLEALLERIQADDNASYRHFHDTSELKASVADDLAVLLTESFETTGEAVDTDAPIISNLPAPADRFIGRDQELDELCRALTGENMRLITLVGAGGIGKTRLAIESANRCAGAFDDGAHLVRLGSVYEAEAVVPAIVQSLNIKGSTVDPVTALVDHLRELHLLLMLDNFEQVVDAAPEIAHVVEECPRVTVLVTSRSNLNVRGQHEILVEPLPLPERSASTDDVERSEAVQLFVTRAQAIDRTFDVTGDNAADVARLCRRLDGLPLALELAAARIRLLTPQAMLERLETGLELLATRSRDVDSRHQTLRAAISSSVTLLDDKERTLFARLGAFQGGCSLEAAAAVCGIADDLELLDLMTSLLDKSLIKHEFQDGEPRFRMLQTIDEYAEECLAAEPDADEIRSRHSDYFLELAGSAHDGLRSSGQTAWLQRLEADHDNLRLAFRWALDHGQAERVAHVGWSMWLFWWLDSHLKEGRDVGHDAIATGLLSGVALAKAQSIEGVMAFWQTDYGHGIPLMTQALETFREAGDASGVAQSQLPLGFVDAAVGNAEGAKQRYEDAIRFFKEAGDEYGTALAINAYCWTSNAIGIDPGDELFEEAVERAEALGTELDLGMALRNMGSRLAEQGRAEEAKSLLARALRTLWRGYVRGGTSYTIDAIAEVAAREGRPRVAARLLAATDSVRQASNAPIIPMFEPRFRAAVERTRSQMELAAFEREWDVGSRLGLDGAAKLGLAWSQGEIEDVA